MAICQEAQGLCFNLNTDLHNSSGIKPHRHNICLCVLSAVIGGGEARGVGCLPAAVTPFASRFGAFSVQERWRGLMFRRTRGGREPLEGRRAECGGRGWAQAEPGFLRKRGLWDRAPSADLILPPPDVCSPLLNFSPAWFWSLQMPWRSALGSGRGMRSPPWHTERYRCAAGADRTQLGHWRCPRSSPGMSLGAGPLSPLGPVCHALVTG